MDLPRVDGGARGGHRLGARRRRRRPVERRRGVDHLTGATIGDAPKPCRECMWWQTEPRREPADRRRWIEAAEEEFGPWGKVYRDGGRVIGLVQYGPAEEFPRAHAMPAGPPSRDAAIITCADPIEAGSPWALQSLILAAIGECRDRGLPALEAFAYRYGPDAGFPERFVRHRTIFPGRFPARFRLPYAPDRWQNRIYVPRSASDRPVRSVLLACCFLFAVGKLSAQTPAGKCVQPPGLYQLANYTVKDISVEPLVKFVPVGPELKQALTAAIANQTPGRPGLWVNEKFDVIGVSFLEDELNQELRVRVLNAKMGLIFARHRLLNCDETARTLEVEYQVVTVARPSYLTTSFEVNDRKDKDKEAAGEVEQKGKKLSLAPFGGYNASRRVFGGADVAYQTDSAAVRKMALSASGSGSSAVVQGDLTGSKQFDAGPLDYAEWKVAYRYSKAPSDGFDLVEATGAARLFAATRPIGSHALIFRFGSSVEAGNRQSTLPQADAPPLTLVDSGYGALKLYVGTSFTSGRQDWKASYGLQLGNSGTISRSSIASRFLTRHIARGFSRRRTSLCSWTFSSLPGRSTELPVTCLTASVSSAATSSRSLFRATRGAFAATR